MSRNISATSLDVFVLNGRLALNDIYDIQDVLVGVAVQLVVG